MRIFPVKDFFIREQKKKGGNPDKNMIRQFERQHKLKKVKYLIVAKTGVK